MRSTTAELVRDLETFAVITVTVVTVPAVLPRRLFPTPRYNRKVVPIPAQFFDDDDDELA